MEGVALEAASIAANYALDNLIVLYDSNDVTLDGPLSDTYREETIKKFIQMGWEVDFVTEGKPVMLWKVDCKWKENNM